MKRMLMAVAVAVLLPFMIIACSQTQQPSSPTSVVSDAITTTSGGGSVRASDAGFDKFGYNYQARLFVGPEDGADRNLDGTYWGDATYAKDHLVMKWSKAWDNARFRGAAWGPNAWIDNEYNGRVPGGSGQVWHYKIVWVGPELQSSQYWRAGGYPVWGQFEVIMDQGSSSPGNHQWYARAQPNGYGAE